MANEKCFPKTIFARFPAQERIPWTTKNVNWMNRDFFLKNYNDKFILVDNGKVIAEYDDLLLASRDRGRLFFLSVIYNY
jgi:hypothetical protein